MWLCREMRPLRKKSSLNKIIRAGQGADLTGLGCLQEETSESLLFLSSGVRNKERPFEHTMRKTQGWEFSPETEWPEC